MFHPARRWSTLAAIAFLALLLAACGQPVGSGSDGAAADPAPSGPSSTSTSTTSTAPSSTGTSTPAPSTTLPSEGDESVDASSGGGAGLSPLAELVEPIGSARYEPPPDPGPAPVWLSIGDIDIDEAPVIDVGVLDNGDMEIPGASEVGWYRFSPTPGEAGSSVLAAHIAYGGEPGVFRHLDSLEPGAEVEIGFEDGSTARFRVTEKAQYPKDELPDARIFAKDGAPELALITCGGSFNRSLRSYDDNIVVYAEPIG